MTQTFSCALIGFFLFSLQEPSNGQNISNQQRIKIEEQVDSIFHQSINAAEHFDFDRLSQGVDDNYQAGFITNGTYYAKFDSLIQIAKARAQGVVKQTISIQKEKITVLSDRIALITACGNSNVEINSGDTFIAKFFWSFVYEKTGNDWKVVQSHQSGIR